MVCRKTLGALVIVLTWTFFLLISTWDVGYGQSASTQKEGAQQILETVKTLHDTPIVAATQTITPTPTPTPTLKPPFAAIDDWHYQLQNMNLQQLRDSAYDLLVMDYSSDGTEDGEYTRGQITGLSTTSNPKKVLAYLCIGEAENYRFYWQSGWKTGNPAFIDQENPDWPGNFAVRYWVQGWKSVITDNPTNYLGKIIAAGFDGVYLDKVDSFEFFEEKVQNDEAFKAQYGQLDFRKEMAALVKHIADVAHSSNPNFIVISQNGLELWDTPGYKDSVSGVAAEEVFFMATNQKRPTEETKQLEGYLREFRKSGHVVLTVDYIDMSEVLKTAEAYQRSSSPENGFIPFVADVNLDAFRVNPGQEPD